ncbi:ArsR/SmtB family transcription factor [Bathymodiolus septemdierum thioautotrophic gill symbiont]|uniref:ArsR family transcriptional regulator n=1 Tax=endosymbiont of Bathymodiolus septemdierum str. Myojin knoll TaxID=1303921 RepID=A0A0P0UT52_9GAMM|nr:metalloregulator ArsR/SmtB family transcription factor [Bathymodiolus septemdierum thioautotrophic gill symbiont]BAS68364.1 ArsR family transcriptional regulator [endosymbiont of Bathymodiolus septemdierum str. Myojin knoll]
MNEFFNVLSDETRLRCLTLICEQKELCVCEIEYALNLPQSKISRHLNILKLNGLIRKRRCGKWVLYSIHPDLVDFQKSIIKFTTTEAHTKSLFQQDSKQLKVMTNRPKIGECDV